LGLKRICEAGGVVEYRLLSNGLRVLLKEDHSSPAATFMVVYECGSRNEGAGTTGAAHFFEHLMFKGTRAFDPLEGNGPMEVFSRVGATLNAMTNYDTTRYFEIVPADHINLCIRIEADRMRGLKNRKADRDSEMTVVRNEFERDENSASSALFKEVMAAAYREHPYHYPIIGSRSDVEGVPLHTMVETFYDRFYWPNNATAIAIGDFDSLKVLAEISKRFGRIPRSPKPIPTMYTREPKQQGERRVEVQRAVPLGEVLVGYKIPEATHPDVYALDALARLLGGFQPSSRLYKALVEKSLVSNTGADGSPMRDPGLFTLRASLAPGASAAEVEAILHAEVERAAKEPATDEELARMKQANRNGTLLSNDEAMSQVMMIGSAVGYGNWKWFAEYDDKFDAVTAADIMRVAAKYLHKNNRTVGTLVPGEPTLEPAQPTPAATKPNKSVERKQRRLKIVNNVRPTNFAEQVKKTVLPNGLTVSVLKRGKGVVSVNVAVAAGNYFGTQGGKRLAPNLVASMLSNGSQRFTKVQAAEKLEAMGAFMRFNAAAYATTLAGGVLLVKQDFDPFVELLGDTLTAPLFDESELTRELKRAGAQLARAKNDTGAQSFNTLMREVYSDGHPLRPQTIDESITQLADLSVADLREFHSKHFSPKSTIITVVGDVEPEEAVAVIEKHFGSWTGPDRQAISVPEPTARLGFRSNPEPVKLALPGKANVDIVVGHATSLSRTSPDYFAARLAASTLGESTISDRLGKVLRVQQGLTYGIRAQFGDTSFGAAPYWISVSVNPANVDKALGLVKEVVGKYVAEGITDEELSDKIGQLAGSFIVALRSCSAIGRQLSEMEFMGLGAAGLDEVVRGYQSVTKADVEKAIRSYLSPLPSVTVMAGTFAE
jgi:zinc protease